MIIVLSCLAVWFLFGFLNVLLLSKLERHGIISKWWYIDTNKPKYFDTGTDALMCVGSGIFGILFVTLPSTIMYCIVDRHDKIVEVPNTKQKQKVKSHPRENM
jgi:hypothetical protein